MRTHPLGHRRLRNLRSPSTSASRSRSTADLVGPDGVLAVTEALPTSLTPGKYFVVIEGNDRVFSDVFAVA